MFLVWKLDLDLFLAFVLVVFHVFNNMLVATEILSQKESNTKMQDACDGNIDGGNHFMINKTHKEVVDVKKM